MSEDKDTSIYLTNLDQCLPSSGLSRAQEPYRWHMVDYEAEGISGTMLIACPETQAPEVRYPLNLKGWHAIYLGVWGDPWSGGGDITGTRRRLIQVKLTNDACFALIERDEPAAYLAQGLPSSKVHHQSVGIPGIGQALHPPLESTGERYAGEVYHYLSECFWKCADLTDQDLILGQPFSAYAVKRMGALAYIRLRPLSESEIKRLSEDSQRDDTKRLIAICDGTGYLWQQGPTTREEIWSEVEPLRNTDFKMLFWQGGLGDSRTYPTQVSSVMGTNVKDFPYTDRLATQCLQLLIGKGINPLKTALEYAHEMGLEFYVGERMGAFGVYPPFEDTYTGPLYRNHPEWRCVDRDGTHISRLSYAFIGVQDYVLSLFRETTSYGADGVHLIFVRGAPFVLYEEPVVEGFKATFGQDPRNLAEDDERWLLYRSRCLTEFMRRLRQLLDETSSQREAKQLRIAASVYGREKDNLFFGMDLATWMQEGLVDCLLPYPWKHGHSADTVEEVDVDYFLQLTRGTACRLYVEMLYKGGARRMPPEEWRKRALALYEAGVDGLSIWDVDHRHTSKAQWSTISRLGQVEKLRTSVEDEEGEDFRFVKLKSIGGYTVDRYAPDWGY